MANTPPRTETRQSNFEQGIALALHLWPDLSLAVTNELGGPDSADKRDWLAGAVSELFPPFAPAPTSNNTSSNSNNANSSKADDIDNLYIQEFLQGVMEDEFELLLEEGDPSLWRVAEQIIRVRRGCAEGNFDGVEALRKKWGENKGKGLEQFKRGEDQDQDTDWDSDEEGGADVDMDEAPALVREPRERAPPEVDEDGFTKVTRKR